MATCTSGDNCAEVSCVIDSGSELSLVTDDIAKQLQVKGDQEIRALSGVGASVVSTRGACQILVMLPTMTMEVKVHIVPRRYLPSDTQLIIGWDIIGQPGVRVEKNEHGLELHYSLPHASTRIMCAQELKVNMNFDGSGLAEWQIKSVQDLVNNLYQQRPAHVMTGELKITMHNNEPVAYRPGTKMAHVDYISRNPVAASSILLARGQPERTLREYQQEHPRYKELKEDRKDSEYQLQDDMIVTKKVPTKYWIQPAARLVVMRKYHHEAAHVGKEKGIAKMRGALFWNGIGQAFKSI